MRSPKLLSETEVHCNRKLSYYPVLSNITSVLHNAKVSNYLLRKLDENRQLMNIIKFLQTLLSVKILFSLNYNRNLIQHSMIKLLF